MRIGARDLREAEDADAAALAALVGGVYAEYQGCVLDLPGVDNDLTAIRTHLAALGGRLWVVPDEHGLRACVGYAPTPDRGTVELKRLYVRGNARRTGLGSALTKLVVDVAATLQADRVELWSDSRFEAAHRLYARLGFVRQPATRRLHDPSDTTEFHFVRAIEPASPNVVVTWTAASEPQQHAALLDDAASTHLWGRAADGRWTYAVTTDQHGRPRHVVATTMEVTLRLSSDGQGRWWRDGERDQALDGCTDIDLEVTPATNSLPIRRADTRGRTNLDIRAAWVRWPSLAVTVATQQYERLTDSRWRYRSQGHPAYELEVDGNGMVRRYGDLWRVAGDDADH